MSIFDKWYEYREQKERERIQRAKDREVARFLSKIKVPQDASQEEINEAVLSYLRKNPKGDVVLSDAQMEDAYFLRKVYTASPEVAYHYQPSQALTGDIEFMSDYLKILHGSKDIWKTCKPEERLGRILDAYTFGEFKKACENPDFVARIASELPGENVVSAVKGAISTWGDFYSYITNSEAERQLFENAISKIAEEDLVAMASAHGSKIIKDMPKGHESLDKMIRAGVECDGFKSLRLLDIDRVVENKDLLLKAYVKDNRRNCIGQNALGEYIKRDLNPSRDTSYMCHGEWHSDTTYSPKHREIQRTLLADAQIYYVLNNGQDLDTEEERAEFVRETSNLAEYFRKKNGLGDDNNFAKTLLKGAELLTAENPDIVKGIAEAGADNCMNA